MVRVARKRAVEEYVNRKIQAAADKKKGLNENLEAFKGIDVEKAMQDIMGLKNKNSCWVMKLDIHNYFNSMPSKKLVKEFERVITDDPRLLDFLTHFFTADVSLSDGHRITEDRGAMAGMPLSAFCANLYLTDLDRLFEKMGVPYFRYSDDILIFAPSRSLAMQYYQIIKQHIENNGKKPYKDI